jgi:hypothetical protein
MVVKFKLLNLTRTRLHHFLKGRHKAEGTRALLGIDLTEYKELFRYPGRLKSARSFVVLAQSSRDILKDRIEQLIIFQ